MMTDSVPSVMIKVDEKNLRGVMCIEPRYRSPEDQLEACYNPEAHLHGHRFVPAGWLDLAAFAQARFPEDISNQFVHQCLRSTVAFHEQWEKLEERHRLAEEKAERFELKAKLSMECNDLMMVAMKKILKGEPPTEEMMERAHHLLKQSRGI